MHVEAIWCRWNVIENWLNVIMPSAVSHVCEDCNRTMNIWTTKMWCWKFLRINRFKLCCWVLLLVLWHCRWFGIVCVYRKSVANCVSNCVNREATMLKLTVTVQWMIQRLTLWRSMISLTQQKMLLMRLTHITYTWHSCCSHTSAFVTKQYK